jgi:hypothetical protein
LCGSTAITTGPDPALRRDTQTSSTTTDNGSRRREAQAKVRSSGQRASLGVLRHLVLSLRDVVVAILSAEGVDDRSFVPNLAEELSLNFQNLGQRPGLSWKSDMSRFLATTPAKVMRLRTPPASLVKSSH